MSSQLIDKFKQLDAYAKTLEDFRIKTTTGAAITVSGGLVMMLLFLSELYTYMSPNISEELFVDTSRGHKLRINLDIVVPTISCNYLVLDAMDSSGEQHLQMEHNIHKRRLDLDGNPIEEPKKEEIATSTTLKQNITDVVTLTCGSCYGAAFNDSQCCNTCEEVKEAYRLRRWALPDLATVEQCKNDESIEKTNNALKEGCQIYGYMEVNRVGGSFHIAPGKSFTINHVHVHDVQPYSSSVFNTTHYINHLSFGTDIEGAKTAPLDGAKGVAKEEQGDEDKIFNLFDHRDVCHLCSEYYTDISRENTNQNRMYCSDQEACTNPRLRCNNKNCWVLFVGRHFDFWAQLDLVHIKMCAVMFQYYLKIVPTMYVKLDRTVVHSNQFSVTRHQKSVSNINAESGMPGAFFSYELSPLMVKYTEKERSIGHFATNICAIIGGVFTVAGILDTLLYHSLNAFQNKMVLGKAG